MFLCTWRQSIVIFNDTRRSSSLSHFLTVEFVLILFIQSPVLSLFLTSILLHKFKWSLTNLLKHLLPVIWQFIYWQERIQQTVPFVVQPTAQHIRLPVVFGSGWLVPFRWISVFNSPPLHRLTTYASECIPSTSRERHVNCLLYILFGIVVAGAKQRGAFSSSWAELGSTPRVASNNNDKAVYLWDFLAQCIIFRRVEQTRFRCNWQYCWRETPVASHRILGKDARSSQRTAERTFQHLPLNCSKWIILPTFDVL